MVGKYPRTQAVRITRRARAEAVQAKSASKTPQERLKALDQAGLVARKERAKLAKKIEKLEEQRLLAEQKKAKKSVAKKS